MDDALCMMGYDAEGEDEEDDDDDENATNEDRQHSTAAASTEINLSTQNGGGAAAASTSTNGDSSAASALASLQLEEHHDLAHISDVEVDPLHQATVDTLIQLARAKQQAFTPILTLLWPALSSTFTNEKYHGYSIGSVGEITQAIGADITSYVKDLIPLLLSTLRDKKDDPLYVRCVSYTLGMLLLKASPSAVESYVADVNQALLEASSVYQAKVKSASKPEDIEDTAAALDNITAALGRLLLSPTDITSKLQLDQTLPKFLSNLPLSVDADENLACYAAVARIVNTLASTKKDLFDKNKDDIIRVLKEGEASPNSLVSEKLKEFIRKTQQQLGA